MTLFCRRRAEKGLVDRSSATKRPWPGVVRLMISASTEQRPSTVIRALGPHIELPITGNEETLAVALNAPRRR
jgi:hypothetical protein